MQADQFAVSMLDVDGVSIGRDEGTLFADRDLSADKITTEKILETAAEYDLRASNAIVDLGSGRIRIMLTRVNGGDSA